MIKKAMKKMIRISEDITADHVGAYAAQSAYFFVLCMIPILLLLLMLIQFTPVTKADVMTAVVKVFPSSVDSMILSIVNQVYNQSRGIIPLTALVALWSAGKGVLAMTSGLNSIYKCEETRNYVFLRIRATFYTVLFLVVIIFLLVLSVFGNSLNIFIGQHFGFLKPFSDWLISKRNIITPVVLMGFSLLIYKFLPNRKATFKAQVPGAMFTAVGWLVISWVFSVYVDIFKGFSSMYGSLTTIVLIMLWLYFCMYGMLLGGEINVILEKKS